MKNITLETIMNNTFVEKVWKSERLYRHPALKDEKGRLFQFSCGDFGFFTIRHEILGVSQEWAKNRWIKEVEEYIKQKERR